MNALINRVRISDSDSPVILPINKIDGIRVSAKIVIQKDRRSKTISWCSLIIDSFHSLYDENDNCDSIQLFNMTVPSPVIYENCIPKMVETISKLRFNKFSGKLNTTDDVDGELEIGLMFQQFENISLNFDKCCVCFDYTKTKTCCGHCVCIECWDKMEKDVCPICRKDMETGHENQDDEE